MIIKILIVIICYFSKISNTFLKKGRLQTSKHYHLFINSLYERYCCINIPLRDFKRALTIVMNQENTL